MSRSRTKLSFATLAIKNMRNVQKAKHEIWVHGRPRSQNKSQKSLSQYIGTVKKSAHSVIPSPSSSPRIDVEIFFSATHVDRGDVDNIIKPLLDALKGIAYLDDIQVRSVKATAIPLDDALRFTGSLSLFDRLTKEDPKEFLIRVFEGLQLKGVL